MSFVNAHYIAYATDLGYSPLVTAGSFSLIGAMSITGAIILGYMSDKGGRRQFLSFSYVLRALGFTIVLVSMGIPFLSIPPLGLFALLFGIALIGLSWTSVVAITAAYASDRFGVSRFGTIYGLIFAVMPIGAGLGASLGGYLHDIRGSYDIALWSILLPLLGVSVLIYFTRDRQQAISRTISP